MDQQEFQSMALEQFRVINSKHEQFQTMVMEQFRLIREEMNVMREDIRDLKDDVRGLKDEIRGIKDDIRRMDERIYRLEDDVHGMNGKLDALYQSRNQVKIKFGLEWIAASFFVAVLASGLTLALNGLGRV